MSDQPTREAVEAMARDVEQIAKSVPNNMPLSALRLMQSADMLRALAPSATPELAGDVVEARYLADRFEWAAPGDRQEDAWIVRFCDKDMREAIFTGPTAEADAWTAWKKYAPAWNIYVFRLAALRVHPHLPDAAKQNGGEWRPIETAPKDGSWILVGSAGSRIVLIPSSGLMMAGGTARRVMFDRRQNPLTGSLSPPPRRPNRSRAMGEILFGTGLALVGYSLCLILIRISKWVDTL